MIEVEHLTKKYGNHAAVRDLSFTAEEGTIYGFLGPNGAGKSTTMNIMTGYLAPTSGTVKIDGFDILKEPEEAKKRIGYLPEVPPVYPDMTVEEYLLFAAELKNVPKAERAGRVEKAMENTRTTDMKDRLIRNLSKGYRQRVGLAQAVINDPQILILDEPTAGLDPQQQIEMFDYLRTLRSGHIIILSSHILSEVSALCDDVWIINNGSLIANDTPDNLKGQKKGSLTITITVTGDGWERLQETLESMDKVNNVRVLPPSGEDKAKEGQAAEIKAAVESDAQDDIRPEISSAIFHSGMQLLQMDRKEESLEDVFLALTGDTGQDGQMEITQGPETGSVDENTEGTGGKSGKKRHKWFHAKEAAGKKDEPGKKAEPGKKEEAEEKAEPEKKGELEKKGEPGKKDEKSSKDEGGKEG